MGGGRGSVGAKASGTATAKAAFAVFAVAVMTLSAYAVMAPNDNGADRSAVADSPDTYTTTITYHANNGAENEDTLQVGYYGIPATEYSPEVWSGTVKNNKSTYTNWTGPSYTPVIPDTAYNTVTNPNDDNQKRNLTLDLSFITQNGTQYTVNLPNTGGIETKYISHSDVKNCVNGQFTVDTVNNRFTFVPAPATGGTQTVSLLMTVQVTLSSVNKVFGGWSTAKNGTDTILPGDVVPTGTTDLYAKWIEPDIFVPNGDIVNLKLIGVTEYTLDIITPYANVGTVNATDGSATEGSGRYYKTSEERLEFIRLPYTNPDTATMRPGLYKMVIPGDNRGAPDLFGTVYHVEKARASKTDNTEGKTEVRYKIYGVGGNDSSGNPLLKFMSAGTYRATGEGAEQVTFLLDAGDYSYSLGGNVALDNIGLRCFGAPGTHSDNRQGALFANGHILILGTGLHNIWIEGKTMNGSPADLSGRTSLPQVFGGINQDSRNTTGLSNNITQAAVTGKTPVYANPDVKDVGTINLGTCVIIHSGIYANVIGGSYSGGSSQVTIGTSDNPLSTYMVFKGGTVTDTLGGGFGHNGNSKIYGINDSATASIKSGGTYVYAIGCNLPADTYEEKASGWWDVGDRKTYSLTESSILQGGGHRGNSKDGPSDVQGSTHVFMSGEATAWDVQAGGRSQYTHTDYSYLEITGRAVVRHIACGTITDGVKDEIPNRGCVGCSNVYLGGDAVVSTLLGAGYDTWDVSTARSMLDGTINVTVGGGHVNNVYGGGFRGTVGDGQMTVNVNVTGGTVHGSVYGGGSGGLDKILHNTNGTKANSGGGFSSSMCSSVVFGNVNVNIGGNAVVEGSVYGGGMSVPKIGKYTVGGTNYSFSLENNRSFKVDGVTQYYEVADVFGDVKVTVGGNSRIEGSVYGAGRSVEVTYDSVNKTYSYPDMTRIETVGYPSTAESPNFSSIPWIAKADTWGDGAYTLTYDNNLCYKNGSSGTGIEEGCRYLNFARVHGNSTVIVEQTSGGYIAGNVYAGAAFGKVTGNTAIEFNSGTAKSDVFGGGLGREGINSVAGTRTVVIRGDDSIEDTDTHYSGVRIEGSVYGGSANGNDGPIVANDSITTGYKATDVVIHRGLIAKDVFGGGLMGKTYGNATVYIGYEAYYDSTLGRYIISMCTHQAGHRISIDNVYAGGNVSTEYDENGKPVGIDPFTKYLVMGDAMVRVYGHEGSGNISISGSIMASGNSCLSGYGNATTAIELEGFHNTAASMTGIHRADTLRMTQTLLNISGRSPLVTIGDTEKILSVYGIGEMIMRYDSHIYVDKPMDCIAEFHSYSKDNKATTVTSPSNEITFTTGSTFYVRGTDLNYGPVTGYTVMSVESQDRYGAYVLGDATLSTGGFVLLRDGSYTRADFSDSNDVRCWYLSGVQRKVVTMNLPAQSEGGVPVQTNVAASVEIQKLQDGTDIRYTGGSFTSVSSDDDKVYRFVRPGTSAGADYSSLGMVVGYLPDQAEKSPGKMYCIDSRKLDIDSGSGAWMYGSYFTEDENDAGTEPERGNESQSVVKPITPATMACPSEVGNRAAGLYSLSLVLTAAHSDRTTYIGYLILNLQESRTVQYEAIENGVAVVKENTMITNKIEVRIDIYVVGSGSGDLSANYSVIMKTKIPNDKSEGTVDVMIPTGMNNGVLTLTGIEYTEYAGDTEAEGEKSVWQRSYNENCKIYVSAVVNQDMTTGWSTAGSPVAITPNSQYDPGGGVYDLGSAKIGTLMGSIAATYRIHVVDFIYPEDYRDGYMADHVHDSTKRPQFTLHFTTSVPGNTPFDSTVKVTLIEKNKIEVSFYDVLRDPEYDDPDVITYYEGDFISESETPSTEANFIGWYYKGTNFSNVYDYGLPVTKPISLEARYSYVVTFDNMDGTSSTMYVAASQGGSLLSSGAVPRPAMTGYDFVGWCKDPDGSRLWDYTSDTVTGDTTLYAKWSGKEIKVHFFYKTSADGDYVKFGGRLDTEHEKYVAPDTEGYYVMMRKGDTLIYPTVKYGSTFNTIDPVQSTSESPINILDFAKSQVEERISGSKFVCWVAYKYDDKTEAAYSVYADTVLTGDMAKIKDSSELIDVINLYAVTATVAIDLKMSDPSLDASTHIAAPSEFLAYPTAPDDVETYPTVYSYADDKYMDGSPILYLVAPNDNGNEALYWWQWNGSWPTKITDRAQWNKDGGFWAYDGKQSKLTEIKNNGTPAYKLMPDRNSANDPGGEVRYYKDADGNWYCVADPSFKTVYSAEEVNNKTVFHATDRFQNSYTKTGYYTDSNNTTWTKEASIVFKDSGNPAVTTAYKIVYSESLYYTWTGEGDPTYLSTEGWTSPTSTAGFTGYYYKDTYGNNYEENIWNNGSQYGIFYKSSQKYKVVYGNPVQNYVWDDTDKEWDPIGNFDILYKNGARMTDSYSQFQQDRTSSQYRLTSGAEAFYMFSYELNQATRLGYQLTGWLNTHVPQAYRDMASSGVSKTLYLFINHLTETTQEGSFDRTVVNKEVIETESSTGILRILTIDFQKTDQDTSKYSYVSGAPAPYNTCPRLDDPEKQYTIDYQADWTQLNYNVNIGSHAHGTIQAYLVNNDGTRTAITTSMSGLHYGDRIELSYTPSGNYAFSKWFISGEYALSPAGVPSTTLIVQGDCTIAVVDVGDRIVNVNIKFDNGKIQQAEDLAATSVWMHNRDTGEYYEMEYVAGASADHEAYRGYIPLGSYDVCVRYYLEEEVPQGEPRVLVDEEYVLRSGDDGVTVGASNNVTFEYYVLSAEIRDEAIVEYQAGTEETVLPSGYREIDDIVVLDRDNNTVFKLTKYTGVMQSIVNSNIEGHTEKEIINNPEDNIPPVRFTVAEGYEFFVFEGFPIDPGTKEFKPDGGTYQIVERNRYPNGSTLSGGEFSGRFDLNWTYYNAPAYVILRLTEGTVDVHYDSYKSGSVYEQGSQAKAYGDSAVPTNYTPKSQNDKIAGWYFDSACTDPIAPSVKVDSDSLLKMGIDYRAIRTGDTDQFGNTYSGDALTQFKVYYMDGETERSKFITADSDPVKNVLNLYYFKDGDDNKYTMRFDGVYRCFHIEPGQAKVYAKVTEDSLKTVTVTVKQANYGAGEITLVSGESIKLERSGDTYTANYPFLDILGHGTFSSSSPDDDVSAVVAAGKTHIVLSSPNAVDGEITINYQPDTLSLIWTVEEGNVSGDGWTYSEGSYRHSAQFGQTVTMPVRTAAPDIIGWTASSGEVDYDSTNRVFKYTADEGSGNVTFTAEYEVEEVHITFNTYKGVFTNGYQSMTMTYAAGTVKGDVIDDNTNLFKKDKQGVIEPGCTLTGFVSVPGGTPLTAETVFNEDMTFLATWNITTCNFKFSSFDSKATVSATRDSSVNPLVIGDAGNPGLHYNTEIIVNIKPVAGYTLDYDATIAASSEGVAFGQPQKLSEDRGFRWSFLLTEDTELVIKCKVISINIDFYVNGERVNPAGADKVSVKYTDEGVEHETYGVSIPMYSVVTFKNYKPEGAENYGTVLWYTDPEFNTPLEYTGSGADATYSQLMTENLSLYAYYNYIIMFHDSDGTGVFKQTIPPQQDTVPLPAFGYDMNDKHKGHIFLGWAVIPTTGDNAGKRVLTYVPEESIPIGDFDETTKRMDLYAYYYTDGSFVKTYNGSLQKAEVKNDDTGEGGQVNIPAANITIQYSTDNEHWVSQIGLTHVNSMNGYYKVNITALKHPTAYKATGSFTMTIVPLAVYVIAPTANMAGDEKTELVVTTEKVKILPINGDLPADTFHFTLKTDEGYSDRQTGIGFTRTRALISDEITNDYRAYYIEGVIAVYDDESAKYESRGYTYVS